MNTKKRIAIYHHFDKDNVIDEHVLYTLREFDNFGCEILFVSNSQLNRQETSKLNGLVSEVTLRENVGYDFAGWKQVLLEKGKYFFTAYDELVILNSTVYGPLFPLDEMFQAMEEKGYDFWAPTGHTAVYGIPKHVQPYILVVQKRLHQSDAFWLYWDSIRETFDDLWDVINNGEIRLTLDWEKAGFKSGIYVGCSDEREMREVGIYEPFTMHLVNYLVQKERLPFVKVKAFYKNEGRPFTLTRFIFSALDATGSVYPQDLIIRHQRRVSPLSWHKNLPTTLYIPEDRGEPLTLVVNDKIGVFGHFFYADMLVSTIEYLKKLPYQFDMYITTGNEVIAQELRDLASQVDWNLDVLEVKVVENRGRDIAPWLLEFRDQHLQYDVALKIHLKKHSQHQDAFGFEWNHYMYECLMKSPHYISEIVNMFHENPDLGIIFPPYSPLYNMVFPEGYYGSLEDQAQRQYVLDDLDASPPAEDCQPIFSAGTMYWYRPVALQKLLTWDIDYSKFPIEPHPHAGTLSHGIERVLPYIAQSAGYSYRNVMPMSELLKGYQMYEDRIMSYYDKIYPESIHVHPNVRQSVMNLIISLRNLYRKRMPNFAKITLKLENQLERFFSFVLREQ